MSHIDSNGTLPLCLSCALIEIEVECIAPVFDSLVGQTLLLFSFFLPTGSNSKVGPAAFLD